MIALSIKTFTSQEKCMFIFNLTQTPTVFDRFLVLEKE